MRSQTALHPDAEKASTLAQHFCQERICILQKIRQAKFQPTANTVLLFRNAKVVAGYEKRDLTLWIKSLFLSGYLVGMKGFEPSTP